LFDARATKLGMGHLRARSEGAHTTRSDCPLTAKPNMAGLDEVICLVQLCSSTATLMAWAGGDQDFPLVPDAGG